MEANMHLYKDYFDDKTMTDFLTHIIEMRKDGAWGGNFELMAIAQIYSCKIEIYEHCSVPLILKSWHDYRITNPSIRVVYMNDHYTSIKSGDHDDIKINSEYAGTFEKKKIDEIETKFKDKKCNLNLDISHHTDYREYAEKLKQALHSSVEHLKKEKHPIT